MAQLSLWLMGSFQVTLDGEPVTDFSTHKAQALLAYLSVEADRAHRRETLAGLLWPDRPRQKARRNLRQELYHLRQAIDDSAAPPPSGAEAEQGGPFLVVNRHIIQFNPESDHWLDVATFVSLAEETNRHRHRGRGTCLSCLRCMRRMVGLYRGEFLEHFTVDDSRTFEEWVLLRREWLHRETMEALIQLANHHERRGEIRQARRYARRQVELEPWREEAHRQLMRLLALDSQRSAALAQYKACRRALAVELGIEPTQETTALYESIRAGETGPPLPRSSAPLHRLPPSPTPFVGREEELTELARLLANPDCRLITLLGPGGIGKSRLALQAAADQVGNFLHGVAVVPLAPISSPDLLVPAIADALGFSFRERQDPERQLLNYVREKELLLVLDGMEHILEGTELLAKMLRQAPGVIMLITSRERVNLREEWVRVIEGLTYPERGTVRRGRLEDGTGAPEEAPDDLVAAYSAIDLFHEQARRGDQRFLLSESETADVVRICQLVEGLPLAVELAAAWTGTRSPQEIAEEIERNLDILSTGLRNVPDRQRSVRATFEYSWQLLSKAEKDLLARLSVFRGGFRREAALTVAGASLSTLLDLVDKSLVRRGASNRYDMHGLLTQYAAEKLRATPRGREETEREHVRYFATFLERQRDHLERARGRDAFQLVGAEIGNARQAWRLAVSHGWTELVERSVETLYLFYDVQGRFQEGIDLFAYAMDRWDGDPERARVLGKVSSRQGALYLRLGRYRRARAALERGLAISQRLEMPVEEVFGLVNLANLAHKQGRPKASARLSHRSLALSREIGDSWGRTESLLSLGLIQYRSGDADQAERFLEESLAIGRESRNPRLLIGPLNVLADIACHRGDYAEGLALFEECLTLSRELGHDFRVALILNNLGTVFHVLGEADEARSAYQESLEICRQIGDRGGQAIALSNLGEMAYAENDYAEAERLYREGLAIGRDIRDQWTVMACLNNLGEVTYALQDTDGARECFAEALTIAQETQTLPVMLKVLVNLAPLFAREGEVAYAAGLLSLALHHPASEQAIVEKAGRLLDEMGITALPETEKPLDAVVAEALALLSHA